MTLPTRIALLLTAALTLAGCGPAVVGGAAGAAAVVHDRRTAGTVLEDQVIELKAMDRMLNQLQGGDQTHISVTSYNNIVLLTGEAATEELRRRAEELARGVDKVRRVHNELALAAPSDLTTRGNDTLITAKVKYALADLHKESEGQGDENKEGADLLHVKVVTERGNVYLMGLLTRAEAAAAADRARRVSGVLRVIKVFEYID